MPFALKGTLASYDASRLTLCAIGSHSALEVASGALRPEIAALVEYMKSLQSDAVKIGPPEGPVYAPIRGR